MIVPTSQNVFGPVPSRRLGQSLGINNIPPKICTYSCVYCQLGRTNLMRIERKPLYEPELLAAKIEQMVSTIADQGEAIDYLTFVADGEPTIDANLGREIDLIRPLGIKIAVITNGSLISRQDVRDDLSKADWVSLKIDAVSEEVWRKIDRPQGKLSLVDITASMVDFSASYQGELATETMLVRSINDSTAELSRIADLIEKLSPSIAYLAIPIRPPAEKKIKPASEATLAKAYQMFENHGIHTEYLIGYEGNSFASTGKAEQDLLSITAVHPMRRDAVEKLLDRDNAGWELIGELVDAEKLIQTVYDGTTFYVRKLPGVKY